MYQRPSMLDILNFKPLNTKKLQMFKAKQNCFKWDISAEDSFLSAAKQKTN